MKRNRKPLRLKGYDYSKPGQYFITICTQNRECLFGDVIDDEMIPNESGMMISKTWIKIENFYEGIVLNIHPIMPNRIHGIM